MPLSLRDNALLVKKALILMESNVKNVQDFAQNAMIYQVFALNVRLDLSLIQIISKFIYIQNYK